MKAHFAISPEKLVESMGGRFSAGLGIDLASGSEDALFAWLVAALLYGGRISSRIAERTFAVLNRRGLVSPRAILDAGRETLIAALDEGGYARYDIRTAEKLMASARRLISEYGGSLSSLHLRSAGPSDLEIRIMALAKGIGPVTAGIFLREMRGIWEKAQPEMGGIARAAAVSLGYIGSAGDAGAWLQTFPDPAGLEAALVRYGLRAKTGR